MSRLGKAVSKEGVGKKNAARGANEGLGEQPHQRRGSLIPVEREGEREGSLRNQRQAGGAGNLTTFVTELCEVDHCPRREQERETTTNTSRAQKSRWDDVEGGGKSCRAGDSSRLRGKRDCKVCSGEKQKRGEARGNRRGLTVEGGGVKPGVVNFRFVRRGCQKAGVWRKGFDVSRGGIR